MFILAIMLIIIIIIAVLFVVVFVFVFVQLSRLSEYISQQHGYFNILNNLKQNIIIVINYY